MFAKYIKKIIFIVAAVACSTIYVAPLKAQEGGGGGTGGAGGGTDYLRIIAENTTQILAKVNDFPNYMATMVEYALNMQKVDDTQTTIDMQSNFATTGNFIVQNATMQLATQPSLNVDLLGRDATRETLPYANDLIFSTMLGQPIFDPDPRNRPNSPPSVNPPYNYLKNAAGISIPHALPRFNWRGQSRDISDYAAYYNAVTATASYNGYVLSNLLAELQNGNGLTNAQMALVTQASNSDWIAQIAAEEIGKVLRQILIFESQTYVLMTQLLQTEKQLLTAQVMGNGLLIALGKSDERMMLARAQGVRLTQ